MLLFNFKSIVLSMLLYFVRVLLCYNKSGDNHAVSTKDPLPLVTRRQRNKSKKASTDSPEEKLTKVSMEEQNDKSVNSSVNETADMIMNEGETNQDTSIFGNPTTNDEKYNKLMEKNGKKYSMKLAVSKPHK